MKKLIVSLIQPFVAEDNRENYIHVEKLIESAIASKTQIICLPERWIYVDPLRSDFEKNLQLQRGEQYLKVQGWAKKYRVGIISGGIWESRLDKKPVISSYYFDSDGNELGIQEKIHLYSVEKKHFEAGKNLVIFEDTKLGIKFSILICFDLNISSELSRLAIKNSAEILFSPTLINHKGLENWGIYARARALENRVPIITCNSIGSYLDRRFLGKSKAIQFKRGEESPLQLIVQEIDDKPGVLTCAIDLEFPNRIRFNRIEENIDSETITIIKKSN